MSADVKIGGEILHDIDSIQLESADTAGTFITFYDSELPTLFAPIITADEPNFKLIFSNNTNNGGFAVTLTAEIEGVAIPIDPLDPEYHYDPVLASGKTVTLTASASNFKSAQTSYTIQH